MSLAEASESVMTSRARRADRDTTAKYARAEREAR